MFNMIIMYNNVGEGGDNTESLMKFNENFVVQIYYSVIHLIGRYFYYYIYMSMLIYEPFKLIIFVLVKYKRINNKLNLLIF